VASTALRLYSVSSSSKLLFLGSSSLTNLLELSLKVDDLLLLLRCMLQQVGQAFGPLC
jgi:hypothetical protein